MVSHVSSEVLASSKAVTAKLNRKQVEKLDGVFSGLRRLGSIKTGLRNDRGGRSLVNIPSFWLGPSPQKVLPWEEG